MKNEKYYTLGIVPKSNRIKLDICCLFKKMLVTLLSRQCKNVIKIAANLKF